jgi:hypothetical protein
MHGNDVNDVSCVPGDLYATGVKRLCVNHSVNGKGANLAEVANVHVGGIKDGLLQIRICTVIVVIRCQNVDLRKGEYVCDEPNDNGLSKRMAYQVFLTNLKPAR